MRQPNESLEKYGERLARMTDRQVLGEVKSQFSPRHGREPGADLVVAKILLEGRCEKPAARK